MSAPKLAIAHHCEGAGHASRMLAIVDELEDAGYDLVLAGGGPGTKFVEANGYQEYEPLTVDFIRDYQHGAGLIDVLRNSMPAAVDRVNQYRAWLAEESPALLLTDDILAAIAATVRSQRYVYISHDPAGFYSNPVEQMGARIRNRIARSTADRFLLPKLWDGEPTIPGTESVPPLAPRTETAVDSVDVLVVPSAYSFDFDSLRTSLRELGRNVTLVGDDDWEVKESLQPYIKGANLVVCSGYSTVMESAVAGTPCVILPATSEQRGVVDAVCDRDGFYAASTVDEVVSLLNRVARPEPHENGANSVAEMIATAVPVETR